MPLVAEATKPGLQVQAVAPGKPRVLLDGGQELQQDVWVPKHCPSSASNDLELQGVQS